LILVQSLCTRISCPCSNCTRGTAPRPGQSRDGPGPAWPPLRELGWRAHAPGKARRELRFTVRQRFPLESQERATRAVRQLEQIPRNGGHRFWRADRLARSLFSRHSPLAGRRKSWSLSGTSHQSERDVQHEYVPPRFLVDREALAERTSHGTRRPVCGPGFLWSPALRGFLHL